jgi:hypothetical protein
VLRSSVFGTARGGNVIELPLLAPALLLPVLAQAAVAQPLHHLPLPTDLQEACPSRLGALLEVYSPLLRLEDLTASGLEVGGCGAQPVRSIGRAEALFRLLQGSLRLLLGMVGLLQSAQEVRERALRLPFPQRA